MTAREFKTRLVRRGRRAGLAITDELADGLWTYFELLLRWNRKINLTAFDTDKPDPALDRLLIEPLLAARVIAVGGARVLDVGSGGGSPAVPLKLAASAIDLVMVEAKTRKSAFLREVVRTFGWEDARVETARVEELLTRPDLHEAEDVATIRAVRVETRLLNHLQAFLKPGGRLFLFQSGPETSDLARPPLVREGSYPLTPDSPGSHLLVLRKQPVGRQPAA